MVDNDLPGDAPDFAEDAPATPSKPAPRRGPGHRGDMRDTVAEMAERAQQISLEAGSKIAGAMKDVIAAGAGIAGFAIESARDVTNYMVRRGQMTPEEAAAAVADVPTSFQYLVTFSEPTQSNVIWTSNYSSAASARYSVGDSAQIVNGVEVVIQNALPFGSAGDPRVPVTGSYKTLTSTGFDGSTPWVRQEIWKVREAPVVIVSGIDARLVEAEAALQANEARLRFLDALGKDTARSDDALRLRIRNDKSRYRAEWLAHDSGTRVNPARFFDRLRAALQEDAIVVADDGNHTFLVAELFPVLKNRHFISPTDFNCMGYCVPAAIGAKLARPKSEVVGIVGDGAFRMTGLELVTAR